MNRIPPRASAARGGAHARGGGGGGAKGMPPNTPRIRYPAKKHCSSCGLCDTPLIAEVARSCAFLGEGMGRIMPLEKRVHGRLRSLEDGDNNEALFGVTEDVFYATNRDKAAVPNAQWTGVTTRIAIAMLEQDMVDAVVCSAAQPDDRLAPRPIVATTVAQVRDAAGNKSTYSPTLSVLPEVQRLGIKRLLFVGVGCQVQALRSVEHLLGLDELYVLGTNCVNCGDREGLAKFLSVASASPDTVVGYEFVQDYRVHIKHMPGSPITNDYERVPYMCLPPDELARGVIGEACRSCFDYTNALADVTVGYMAVPWQRQEITEHATYVTVRNARGRAMVDAVAGRLAREPGGLASSRGLVSKEALVMQTLRVDDRAWFGEPSRGMPRILGEVLAYLLTYIGPQGFAFASYSIEFHILRNYLHTVRTFAGDRAKDAASHVPPYARAVVDKYDRLTGGEIARMLAR